MSTAAMMLGLAMIATPVLAQQEEVPVTMVDCVLGGPCVGTPGNDTINGSDKQDVIYGLEGDDIIDSGNDSVTDCVFCGPGFDTVDQMPRIVDYTQDAIQYGASDTDVIADDCEVRAM